MLRSLPLALAGSLLVGALATAVARAAGTRWAWIACASAIVAVALLGASRIGTANPYSRTARFDPLLFFVMLAMFLAPSTIAAVWATAGADPATSFLRSTLWSALLFIVALPVGFVAAVAVEVLWPH
jgi:hypothetical protein